MDQDERRRILLCSFLSKLRRGYMVIEESEYQTFDPGWDCTFLTSGYFYKHTNPQDLK